MFDQLESYLICSLHCFDFLLVNGWFFGFYMVNFYSVTYCMY